MDANTLPRQPWTLNAPVTPRLPETQPQGPVPLSGEVIQSMMQPINVTPPMGTYQASSATPDTNMLPEVKGTPKKPASTTTTEKTKEATPSSTKPSKKPADTKSNGNTKTYSSAKTSFKSAFRAARGAGAKEFVWNGKRYTTQLKSEKKAKSKVKLKPMKSITAADIQKAPEKVASKLGGPKADTKTLK